MTVDANAAPIIASIAAVLSAAPAWRDIFPGADNAAKSAAALAASYYPEAPGATVAPFCEVQLEGRDATVRLHFPISQSVAQCQDVSDALTYQLQSRFRLDMTGVLIPQEPVASDVLDATEAAEAGNNPTRAVVLTFPVGIQL